MPHKSNSADSIMQSRHQTAAQYIFRKCKEETGVIRTVTLTEATLMPCHKKVILERFSNMKSLELIDCNILFDMSAIKKLKNLTCLNIKSHNEIGVFLQDIATIKQLKKLSLQGPIDGCFESDISRLKQMPNLQYLKINNYVYSRQSLNQSTTCRTKALSLRDSPSSAS